MSRKETSNPVNESNATLEHMLDRFGKELEILEENVNRVESTLTRLAGPAPKEDSDAKQSADVDNFTARLEDRIEVLNTMNDRLNRANTRLEEFI